MSSVVHAALARRFAPPEYATFFEVADATGSRHTRHADAVAMGIWPSRGLALEGFEVKVSRSDWLREKRDPNKSAPIQRFMDRWWVAVSDDSIVQDGELPTTWGLLVLQKGGKLVTKVKAPDLVPEPVTRSFLAALLRRATESTVQRSVVDEIVAARAAEARKAHAEQEARAVSSFKNEINALRQQVEAFEKSSGVSVRGWEGSHEIGRAVRMVLDNRGSMTVGLERVSRTLDDLAKSTRETVAELRDLATLEDPAQARPMAKESES